MRWTLRELMASTFPGRDHLACDQSGTPFRDAREIVLIRPATRDRDHRATLLGGDATGTTRSLCVGQATQAIDGKSACPLTNRGAATAQLPRDRVQRDAVSNQEDDSGPARCSLSTGGEADIPLETCTFRLRENERGETHSKLLV